VGSAAGLFVPRRQLFVAQPVIQLPTIPNIWRPSVNGAGYLYPSLPEYTILHASRGNATDVETEYQNTVGWAQNPANELGWTWTIGERKYARHLAYDRYLYNAYDASRKALAAEFAQAREWWGVTQGQVEAFCAAWYEAWLFYGKRLPLLFFTHSEVEAWGWTRLVSGKTDVFSFRSPLADELRARILRQLASMGVTA